MRISGRDLNRKEESFYRSVTPDFRQGAHPPPIVVNRSRAGLVVTGVILTLLLAGALGYAMLRGGAVGVPTPFAGADAAIRSKAVADLRTFHTAEVTYFSVSDGRYGTFEDLINARLIADRRTQRPEMQYNYTLTRSADAQRYCIAAVSPRQGAAFGVGTDGTIYQSAAGGIACENGELQGSGQWSVVSER